ncbi:MAG: TIR domain-containing protein [Kofleriaceae bacterium]|nr:TIR domain-containing protein [Kofleriaceae bacterium]MBP9169855.1 TIR domain-containing protein [Kofleriaceae bacterium]MBP9858054.1 TIR domain-containing protein [Kofleriaceae bacterium]
MANPRAFISFDFDNNERERNLFAGQCSSKSPTPFSAQDWSSKEPLPQRQWEDLIREKIGRCHVMFVLIGRSTHRAAGVAKEIQMAIAQNVPFCGVYVDGANSSTPLPEGLARNRTVTWDWPSIAHAVDVMMKQGKNK